MILKKSNLKLLSGKNQSSWLEKLQQIWCIFHTKRGLSVNPCPTMSWKAGYFNDFCNDETKGEGEGGGVERSQWKLTKARFKKWDMQFANLFRSIVFS